MWVMGIGDASNNYESYLAIIFENGKEHVQFNQIYQEDNMTLSMCLKTLKALAILVVSYIIYRIIYTK